MEDHPFDKIKDSYKIGASDNETPTDSEIFEWLFEVIPSIPKIGDYGEDETPYDQFDSKCHKVGTGISTKESKENINDEDELIFMINLSEHVKRPEDMLMFLGEYFKHCVAVTQVVEANTNGSQQNPTGKKKQDKFFVTTDIINYLGTACKMYIEDLRQELRISIALFRNPTFNDSEEQRESLSANIKETQILIIKRCIQIYKFIDYFHDQRKEVPLKYLTQQPPPYILNAFFVKMKADYLRYIYECLSGDNSLLGSMKNEERNFQQAIKDNQRNQIAYTEDMDVVDSEIYYSLYPLEGNKNNSLKPKVKLEHFYSTDMTLLKFLEHEIVFEYEKAKDQLFDNSRRPKKYPKKEYVLDHEYADFHPVFLSSLLNQTVFLGDVQEQIHRQWLLQSEIDKDKNADKNENQIDSSSKQQSGKQETQQYADVYRTRKDNLQKLYTYVLRWTDEIDNYSYIMNVQNKESQETARSIQNLLERALESWKDPK